MQLALVPHPAAPPSHPQLELWASVEYAAQFGPTGTLNIWYGIKAPLERFAIAAGKGERVDELWQSTCFEAFLRAGEAAAYREWNFAPSGDWAAYEFTDRREGRADASISKPPYIRVEDNLTWWTLGATVAVDAQSDWRLGLSAILEEVDGTKSYWALAHPEGDAPDFHDPVCFAARLA